MNSDLIILVYDRERVFREALRNFLFTAGHSNVDVVPTVREALAKLRHKSYGCVLFGVSRPHFVERRLLKVIEKRQPGAKVLFLVSAEEAHLVRDSSFDYIIKERVFSTLLDSLSK